MSTVLHQRGFEYFQRREYRFSMNSTLFFTQTTANNEFCHGLVPIVMSRSWLGCGKVLPGLSNPSENPRIRSERKGSNIFMWIIAPMWFVTGVARVVIATYLNCPQLLAATQLLWHNLSVTPVNYRLLNLATRLSLWSVPLLRDLDYAKRAIVVGEVRWVQVQLMWRRAWSSSTVRMNQLENGLHDFN
jgi:hypothetical protein